VAGTKSELFRKVIPGLFNVINFVIAQSIPIK
jgi:hypothetical protein